MLIRQFPLSVFFTITICAFQLSSSAQVNSAAFKWGDDYDLPAKYADLGLLGNPADGFLQLGCDNRKALIFMRFDAGLHFIDEKEAKLDDLPRSCTSEFALQLGGKYYWFYSTADRGEDGTLYAQELNPKDMTLAGPAREILRVEDLGENLALDEYGRRPWNRFSYYQSPDQQKLLITYRKRPKVRNDSRNNDVIGFQVFDSALTKMRGTELTMPYTEKMMNSKSYRIDDKGDVYVVAKVYNSSESDDRNNFHLEVLRWSAGDGARLVRFPARLPPGYFSSDGSLAIAKDGGLSMAGFYATKKDGPAAGVFLQKLQPAGASATGNELVSYPFPDSSRKLYEDQLLRTGTGLDHPERVNYVWRQIAAARDEIKENLIMRGAVVNENGSIELFGEAAHVEVTGYAHADGSHDRAVNWSYGDIWSAKINAEGTLAWFRLIPKSQAGGLEVGAMSFRLVSSDKKSMLLYMTGAKGDVFHDTGPGTLTCSVVNGDGVINTTNLITTDLDSYNISVIDFKPLSNNQWITRGKTRHNVYKIGLMTLQ